MAVAIGSLAGVVATAATPPPIALNCTVVGTWACAEGKTCEARSGAAAERYRFDLSAMTYQGPADRGPITDLQTDDGGFMRFVPGTGRLYVHKNSEDGDPMTSYLYLSSGDMRELQCTARYARTPAERAARPRRALAGRYYLSGVMETGSELLLRPDGSFAWFLRHGAVDQVAEGGWQIAGDAVVLDAATSAGRQPPFRQLRLPVDGGSLRLPGTDKGRYGRRP